MKCGKTNPACFHLHVEAKVDLKKVEDRGIAIRAWRGYRRGTYGVKIGNGNRSIKNNFQVSKPR